MVISLADIISIIILPIGALIFLGLALYLRGQFWWPILSGLLWILFGFSSVSIVTEVFAYQRLLGTVWIVIGIAVIWMPAYYKKKGQQKTLQEMAAEADGEYLSEEDKLDREISRVRQERWKERRGLRRND
jgi:uncharacterized membrane protein YuzA (DUF378 family)